MNLTKFSITATLFFSSLCTQAALIEYNGYSRESSSNIVSGNNQEWLMWTETTGKTVNWFLHDNAAANLRNAGWQLAGYAQMNQLFNNFQFSATKTFNSAINIQQDLLVLPWATTETSPVTQFIDLFGDTFKQAGLCYPTCNADDRLRESRAAFGDTQEMFGYGLLVDDFTNVYGQHNVTQVSLNTNLGQSGTTNNLLGLALYRPATATNTVPEPTTLFLLMIGIAGLVIRNFRFYKFRI